MQFEAGYKVLPVKKYTCKKKLNYGWTIIPRAHVY